MSVLPFFLFLLLIEFAWRLITRDICQGISKLENGGTLEGVIGFGMVLLESMSTTGDNIDGDEG